MDSTELLLILQVLKWGFKFGVSQYVPFFVTIKLHIFAVGKIIYGMGNFDQFAGLINWVGKIIYQVVK